MNKRILAIIIVLLFQMSTIKQLSGMELRAVMQSGYLNEQLQVYTENMRNSAERRDELLGLMKHLEGEEKNMALRELTDLFRKIANFERDIEKIKQLQRAFQLAQENNKSSFDESTFDGKWVDYTLSGIMETKDVDPAKRANEFIYTLVQMPALSQRHNERDQTNLCGYYCLFNAESLANNQENQIMNREAFLPEFASMLALIAQHRNLTITSPLDAYQNLADTEIFMLLMQKELAGRILLLSRNTMDFLKNPTNENLRSMEASGFNGDALLQQQRLFQQFKNNRLQKLAIIYLTRIGGHYIAVLVERPSPTEPNLLHFTVYDSLGTNYVDTYSDIRQMVIQLLYDFLTQ